MGSKCMLLFYQNEANFVILLFLYFMRYLIQMLNLWSFYVLCVNF